MAQEQIGAEWAVIHPCGFGSHDFFSHRDQLPQIIVAAIRVHDDTVVRAALIEIRFFKSADLDRRVHKEVVIWRYEISGW